MTYRIWTVYQLDNTVRYFIINTKNRQVQSTWKNFKDAKIVCDSLNKNLKQTQNGSVVA